MVGTAIVLDICNVLIIKGLRGGGGAPARNSLVFNDLRKVLLAGGVPTSPTLARRVPVFFYENWLAVRPLGIEGATP